MATHTEGPYQGLSSDGKRLFDELNRLLAHPNGLGQLFDEFGRRQVCDAILSEEPPICSCTIAEIQASLDGFFASKPDMAHRRFEFTMKVLPEENSATRKEPVTGFD